MNWIDRLAIVWAVLVLALLVLIEGTVLSPGDRFGAYFPREVVVVVGLLAGVPWAIARGIHWALRRRNSFTYRVLR